MKTTSWCLPFAALVAIACTSGVDAQSVPQAGTSRASLTLRTPRAAAGHASAHKVRAVAAALSAASALRPLSGSTQTFPPGSIQLQKTLPLWTFDVVGSRDGDHHQGVLVGHDPFRHPGTDRIPTFVIPLIVRTHVVATAYDPTTGNFATTPGVTTVDPTQPDDTCLAKPNDNPTRLLQQSPFFNPAQFVFGGTYVGTTQYVDAFQRANFWAAIDNGSADYHVLLQPVTTVAPIVIDVPSSAGLAVTDGALFQAAYGFSFCAPQLLLDINWFDSYLQGTVIPALAASGVAPDTLPIFLVYNTAWPLSSEVTNLFDCCAVGYHATTGAPIAVQTYAVTDFDTTGFFSGGLFAAAKGGFGFDVTSHEIAEWMNDPFASNNTAAWGNVGQQVGSCQNIMEVGDPLTNTDVAPVTMPNGYSYSLQELTFFSWFFGAPSIGVNGWYSDNGTFTTDAGPNCQIQVD